MRKLKQADLKNLKQSTSVDDVKLITAVIALHDAYNNKDRVAIKKAFEMVFPYIADIWAGENPRSAEQAKRMAEGESTNPWRVGDEKLDEKYQLANAQQKISQLVTRQLDRVRLVWWFSGEEDRFVPAAYCPDVKTAVFVHAFIARTSRLRVCPHCGTMFISVKTNIDYCSPAHRDAHRVARWRAGKKEHGPKFRKKERKSRK
jgi:hypothetical protein